MGVDYPTRDQVQTWLQEYDGQLRPTKKLTDYLLVRMDEAGFNNLIVRGSTVVRMILDDLNSYA